MDSDSELEQELSEDGNQVVMLIAANNPNFTELDLGQYDLNNYDFEQIALALANNNTLRSLKIDNFWRLKPGTSDFLFSRFMKSRTLRDFYLGYDSVTHFNQMGLAIQEESNNGAVEYNNTERKKLLIMSRAAFHALSPNPQPNLRVSHKDVLNVIQSYLSIPVLKRYNPN